MQDPLQPFWDTVQDMATALGRAMETASQRRQRRDQETAMKGVLPPWVRIGHGETSRQLNSKVQEATNRANTWLFDLGFAEGMAARIDEVALVLPPGLDRRELWFKRMLNRIGKDGFTYFNQVSKDTVKCQPIPSSYTVDYDFFTTGVEGVRLELLSMGLGHSPLHQVYDLIARDDAAVVHASFKLGDEAEYRNALELLAIRGWVCGQACESSYGRFSYWRKADDDGSLLWLKPRINLRDKPGLELLLSPEDLDGRDEEFYEEEDEDED